MKTERDGRLISNQQSVIQSKFATMISLPSVSSTGARDNAIRPQFRSFFLGILVRSRSIFFWEFWLALPCSRPVISRRRLAKSHSPTLDWNFSPLFEFQNRAC
jgi:hypothetical protein